VEDDNLVTVVFKVCNVSDNKGWWVDIGATRQICGGKSLFITYEKLDVNEKLYTGNVLASIVEGK